MSAGFSCIIKTVNTILELFSNRKQMQSELIQLSKKATPFLKPKIQNFAQAYYQDRFQEEYQEGSYITSQTLKAIFNILLKLSYGIFVVGIILTIQSKSITEQNVIKYIQQARNQTFLITLILLGVVILTLLKIVKEDSKITAKTKKIFNFIVDILRTAFYVLSLIFAQPFVFDNNNTVLFFSFWTFVAATFLFVGRKIMKWAYFLFDSKGKLILAPWQSKDPTKKENLSKFADFIQYVFKKSLNDGPESIIKDISKQKMDKLKIIQAKILSNLHEKGNLMKEVDQLFS